MLMGIVIAMAGVVVVVTGLAPQNRYLSSSSWPIAHHDCYFQASTHLEGPDGRSSLKVEVLFGKAVSGTLMLFSTKDPDIVWGCSTSAIYKLDLSTFKVLDAVRKPPELSFQDTFNGIYSFVSQFDVLYTAIGSSIVAAGHANSSDLRSPIRPLGRFDLDLSVSHDDTIIGLQLLYSGYIVFITTHGLLGVITQDLATLLDVMRLQEEDATPLSVTNGIAIDEYDGIYVVSSKYVHRVWFNSEARRLDFRNSKCENKYKRKTACNSWKYNYHHVDDQPFDERISKSGSGTSPSLMKLNNTVFVLIADGARKQNVLVIEAFTGTLAATTQVNFGNPSTESYTEQSFLVHKNKFVIVQNALTSTGQRLNKQLIHWNAKQFAQSHPLPPRIVNNVYLLPILLGDAPRGLSQFAFHPKKPFEKRLSQVWLNAEDGCPNSIPSLSVPTQLLYCVGKGTRLRSPGLARESLDPHEADPFQQKTAGVTPLFKFFRDDDAPSTVGQRLAGRVRAVRGNIVESDPSVPLRNLDGNMSDSWMVGDPSSLFEDPTIMESNGTSSVERFIFNQPRIPGTANVAVYPQYGGFEGFWTLSAFNWTNGKKVFDYRTGGHIMYNSLYAATQIVRRHELVTGTVGGIVRLSAVK